MICASVVMDVPAVMDQDCALAVELKHGPNKVLLLVLKLYPGTSTLNQILTSMYPPENL